MLQTDAHDLSPASLRPAAPIRNARFPIPGPPDTGYPSPGRTELSPASR